jgi:hypothetical protein
MLANQGKARAAGPRTVCLFKCPTCGHKNQAADGRTGKRIKCSACEYKFISAAYESIADASFQPTIPSTTRDERRVWERIFPDQTAALKGLIIGTIVGISSGVFGPIAVGILAGQSVGEILGRILIGFMVGFGVGALLGAIVGGRILRGQPEFRIEAGWTVTAAGAIIGSVVGMVVERFWWFPVVAGAGALGANFWPMLRNKLESAVNVPHHMNREEHLIGEGGEEGNGRPYQAKGRGRSRREA